MQGLTRVGTRGNPGEFRFPRLWSGEICVALAAEGRAGLATQTAGRAGCLMEVVVRLRCFAVGTTFATSVSLACPDEARRRRSSPPSLLRSFGGTDFAGDSRASEVWRPQREQQPTGYPFLASFVLPEKTNARPVAPGVVVSWTQQRAPSDAAGPLLPPRLPYQFADDPAAALRQIRPKGPNLKTPPTPRSRFTQGTRQPSRPVALDELHGRVAPGHSPPPRGLLNRPSRTRSRSRFRNSRIRPRRAWGIRARLAHARNAFGDGERVYAVASGTVRNVPARSSSVLLIAHRRRFRPHATARLGFAG